MLSGYIITRPASYTDCQVLLGCEDIPEGEVCVPQK